MLKISKNQLGKQIAEGGEGTIWRYKGNLIKIYKSHIDKAKKEKKISILMNKTFPKEVISPIEPVYNTSGKFTGYMMREGSGEEFVKLSNRKFISLHNVTVRDILSLLTQLKEIVISLHTQNVLISDFNDRNILFNGALELSLIDCDSWSLEGHMCEVAMESFLDPLFYKSKKFTDATDFYAFAVILFKSLTRLHPFGGVTDPDISLLTRMKDRISVVGDKKKIKTPPTMAGWEFFSPALLKDLKEVFENDKRFLIDKNLMEMLNQLTLCQDHKDYYYSKYLECPVCIENAKLQEKPERREKDDANYRIYWAPTDAKLILDSFTYVDNKNRIRYKDKRSIEKFIFGHTYNYFEDGSYLVVSDKDTIWIRTGQTSFIFQIQHNSDIVIKDPSIYCIENGNSLLKINVTPRGNEIIPITSTSFSALFNVVDEKTYLVCNQYDEVNIVDINGYNFEIRDGERIKEYGIHYDEIRKEWLFVYKKSDSTFRTLIFDNNVVKFDSTEITYQTTLSNICIYNGIIYIPYDGYIRGYSFKKNAFRDFNCPVIQLDSKLEKFKDHFMVTNLQQIYKVW